MCNGYDPKAVKIGKPIKTLAATIKDKHKRKAFIRSYVKIAEEQLRSYAQRKGK
jgi:hypothetical protein